MTVRNREQWLAQLASRSARHIADVLRDGGDEEPIVRISCGFTPTSRGSRGLADLLPPSVSSDDTAEIFISPVVDDARQVARLLLPLLVMAHAGTYKDGHAVQSACYRLGLNEESLPDWLEREITRLGLYPHASVNLQARPKQTTRLVKAVCYGDVMNGEAHDAYIVRLSRSTYEMGAPICPLCNESLNAQEGAN
jgi:hypothetical protein